MGVTIFSADRGEGKTTFLLRYAVQKAERGRSVGGIVSPAVFESGQRIGYDLIDLRSGNRRLLARVVTSPGDMPSVGIYRFDDEAVVAGNTAVMAAVRDGLDVIGIDEVGPLEYDGKGWTPALEVALHECRSWQELIVVVRLSLMDDLPTRFPSALWEEARRVSPPWPSPRSA